MSDDLHRILIELVKNPTPDAVKSVASEWSSDKSSLREAILERDREADLNAALRAEVARLNADLCALAEDLKTNDTELTETIIRLREAGKSG